MFKRKILIPMLIVLGAAAFLYQVQLVLAFRVSEPGFDMTVSKADSGETFYPGDTIVYQVTAENIGTTFAPQVFISETVPAHTTMNFSASSPGWQCSPAAGPAGANCVIEVGDIEAAASVDSLFAVDVDAYLPADTTSTLNVVSVFVGGSGFPETSFTNNAATDLSLLSATRDTDGDGVIDDEDAFPNDPTRAVSCEAGFFGAFSCQPAPLGRFVPTAGALTASLCPVGTFSDVEGAVACQPAPLGTFVSTTGAAAATFCPVGTFSDVEGAAACQDAQPGYFVDFQGAAAQSACQPGTYQPLSGATSCLLADPGFFVDAIAATAQIACPAGFTSEAGAVECTRVNTAPTAVVGGPYLTAVNTTISLDGSASTDPEGDALTELWTAAGGTVAGSSYTAGGTAGIFDVCLTVNDGELDSAAACTFVVVYDPSGGFVTGGGWIDSPAGAYNENPELSGYATFSFIAKYRKNVAVPRGGVLFNFRDGGLWFRSTSYAWLVVDGDTAQIRGEGRINGVEQVQFALWAGDGSPDTLRIHIWDETGTIYDNGADSALGGGRIRIHETRRLPRQ